MPGIDQILSFVVKQGGNELRLGTDQEPAVFAKGTRLRFTMAPTSNAVLRQLLGDILSPEREGELQQKRHVAFEYDLADIGHFQVVLAQRQGDELSVTFVHSSPQIASTLHHATRTSPIEGRAPKPSFVVPDAGNSSSRAASATGTECLSPARSVAVDEHAGCCPTPKLVELVKSAIQARASDIHLADGQVPFLRVDGRLRTVPELASTALSDLFSIDDAQKAKALSGYALELALDLGNHERIRVTLYRADGGLAVAIRILPPYAPSLSELNLPLPLHALAEYPNGLVLVCGATGSGKSTTLAALLCHALQHRSVLLVTLEDPIEFVLSGSSQSIVRQRQIGRDVTDFASGLRDALRSDPDVIMVGELRDADTIRLALTAAETGHLVLASLHSGSTASCVERVVDAYPAEQRPQIRVQLAETLRAVVVQKLVPRAHGSGRAAAIEVLRATHAVANMIREGKTAQIGTALQAGKRDGMLSLERCLADYVQSGMITLQQAKSAANDLDSLTMYLAK